MHPAVHSDGELGRPAGAECPQSPSPAVLSRRRQLQVRESHRGGGCPHGPRSEDTVRLTQRCRGARERVARVAVCRASPLRVSRGTDRMDSGAAWKVVEGEGVPC